MVQRYTEVAYPYGRLDFVCDVLRHVVILQPVTPTDSWLGFLMNSMLAIPTQKTCWMKVLHKAVKTASPVSIIDGFVDPQFHDDTLRPNAI